MTFRGDYAQGQGGNVNTSSGGGRGGGGLGNGAMMLLPLLLRGGGGGTIILVLLALLYFSGAFDGILGGGGDSQSQSQGEYSLEHCQEAGSSNEYDDCRAAATMGSLNTIWADILPAQSDTQFTKPEMTIFKGSVNSGCGYASSDTGPFYCPQDKTAYLDVSFFDQLSQLGGSNGPLAQEYATAHEYGHHIQNLEGTCLLYTSPSPRDRG